VAKDIILAVELERVSFAYEAGSTIFSELSLLVETGSSHAILGASGCGKSTLLKMIAGLLPNAPSSVLNGVIRLGNFDVIKQGPELLNMKRQGKIGYLSQKPVLFDNMSVEQNVAFPTEIIGTYDRAKINSLIEMVGMEEHKKKYPRELSGGMLTRTALARLFSTSPDYLLLDEPFSSLDIARRTILYKQFQNLKTEHSTTTVLVTHDIFEAMVFAPCISLMSRDGKIVPYRVDGWVNDLNYDNVVEKYFADFSKMAEVISRDG
jgi:ABC-type nitrate/sulfonate/bicarbonate transport system ATPase subunit